MCILVLRLVKNTDCDPVQKTSPRIPEKELIRKTTLTEVFTPKFRMYRNNFVYKYLFFQCNFNFFFYFPVIDNTKFLFFYFEIYFLSLVSCFLKFILIYLHLRLLQTLQMHKG